MTLAAADLNPKQFQKISDMVYRTAGINLKEGKEALVRARLMKRLRFLGMSRVEDYIEFIDSDQGTGEVAALIDVMTTNKTSFFREVDHFHFLREHVLPGLNMPRLRFWSAACSSGEEPYTLAILLREHLPELDRKDVRILATDISRRMLDKALQAVYPQDAVDEVPAAYRKYFTAQHKGRGPRARALRAFEPDGSMADEGAFPSDLLPQRDDLFRPIHPAGAHQPVLGLPGARGAPVRRPLGGPFVGQAPFSLRTAGGVPEVTVSRADRGIHEPYR
jgi:hypothetical protein